MDIEFLFALTQSQGSREPFSIVSRDGLVLLCQSKAKTYTQLAEIPKNTFVTGWQNFDGLSGHWTSWHSIKEINSTHSKISLSPNLIIPSTSTKADWSGMFSELDFINTVKQMQKEMNSGEYFLANLTRTLHLKKKIDLYYLAAMGCIYHDSPFRYFEHNLSINFLGLSPERFLKIESDKVTCEPMKGTAQFSEQLRDNEKEHDENTMMIDLTRSDLSKICDPHTINVEDRNIISTHPGLSQMSSKITGTLNHHDILEAIALMMPVASTSGTPKPRVIRAISQCEPESRNQYCGAYGWIDTASKSCDLAVSIRCIISNESQTSIGIGAGITIDSDPISEWQETQLKASRLKQLVDLAIKPEPKGVFTSTSVRNSNEIFALALHKERLLKHAELEGLSIDETELDQVIEDLFKNNTYSQEKYLKIMVDGKSNVTAQLLKSPAYIELIDVGISFLPNTFENETTKIINREFYERAMDNAQSLTEDEIEDAIVIVNGLIAETTRANIFIELDGKMITPPLNNPLLSGIARTTLLKFLKDHEIDHAEKEIHLEDLHRATEIVTINSVRGPQRVNQISSPLFDGSQQFNRSNSKLFELAKKSFNSQLIKI